MAGAPHVTPFDYDLPDDEFRSGVGRRAGQLHCTLQPGYQDVHASIADDLLVSGVSHVLDLGCGTGTLGEQLDERGIAWVGIDRSLEQLKFAKGLLLRGDATRLPFADETFDAVAALYMLYHFDSPTVPMREALRVLKPGGLFVCCAPSRHNWPELVPFLPPQPIDPFDSENGPAQIEAVFGNVRTEPWDMRVYRLPDEDAVWTHLVARQVPDEDARTAARQVKTPLWVRAKGAVMWASRE